MPGDYLPPFANPCAQPAWTCKAGKYRHRDPRWLKVPAWINKTTVTDDSATTNLVTGRVVNAPTCAGSIVGASSIDDWNYNCGTWPDFWSNADGATNIRFPANAFRNTGATVDLSGDCKAVGFQNAQFIRWRHGMYGFNRRSNGLDCAGSAYSTFKYRKMVVAFTATLADAWVLTNYDGSGTPIGTLSKTYSNSASAEQTTEVNKLTGERTASWAPYYTSTLHVVQQTNGTTDWSVDIPDGGLGNATYVFDDTSFSNLQASIKQFVANCDSGSQYVAWPMHQILGITGTPSSVASDINALSNDYWSYNADDVSVTEVGSGSSKTCVLHFKITTHTKNYTWPHSPGDPYDVLTHTGGNNVYELTVTLSEPNDFTDVLQDITDNMEPILFDKTTGWDNLARWPIRKDTLPTVAPVYRRRELQGSRSPFFFPDSTTINDYTNKISPGVWGQKAWVDEDAYRYIYEYTHHDTSADEAINHVTFATGDVLDLMLPEGYGRGTPGANECLGAFDFNQFTYAWDGTYCNKSISGQWNTAALDQATGRETIPPNCTHWTDAFMSGALFPCEFISFGFNLTPAIDLWTGAYNDPDLVIVQRYREVHIRVPSENACRPYGSDRDALNWSLADHCDVGGNVVTASNNPLPKKWPNCPGLVFSEAQGVGGRVKVTAIDGSGVITLDIAQPYFCTSPANETVKVYDASMTLLGTASASRVDSTHFGGFGSYPTAKWITPQFRNDGSTPWVYSDCDDYPKGTWIEEHYVINTITGATVGSPTATLQCVPLNGCLNWLRVVATAPGSGQQTALGVIRQWQNSAFYQTKKECVLDHGSYVLKDILVDSTVCATLPDVVEATSTTPDDPPSQVGIPAGSCSAANLLNAPWNWYLNCTSKFPL
jgi:hypothetical protein